MKRFGRDILLLAAVAVLAFAGRSLGDVWTEQTILRPSDAAPGDFFGQSASISGDRIIVGALQGLFGDPGEAYVFRRDDNATPFDLRDDFWIEEAALLASDGAVNDLFGGTVSISGDRALVGSSRVDGVGPDSGAAYVFRREDNGTPSDPADDFWVQEAKLTASDAAAVDLFGLRVALSGDLAVVGAILDDDACPNDPMCDSGSAYVFRLDDNGTPGDTSDDAWVEQAKLTASDAAAGDRLGDSVTLSGDVVVIGATRGDGCPSDPDCESGAVYVFRRDDSGSPTDPTDDSWVEEAKLTAPDAEAGDRFGTSVSISGNRLIVGAWLDDDACPTDPDCESGSAYVFRRTGGAWVEEAKLTASDAVAGDVFGFSVSISGDRVVVGSLRDDDACADDPDCESGAAYLFRRSDNGTPHDPTDDLWVERSKLVASDAAAQHFFGISVAVDAHHAVVGAILAGSIPGAGPPGAAYVFVVKPIGPTIPTLSTWGVGVMVLFVLIAGTMLLRHRRAFSGKHAKLDPERRGPTDKGLHATSGG